MRVCDICKSNNVQYRTWATIKDNGAGKELELCRSCYDELQHREMLHRHQAYEETVKAITGEIPRKSRWWHCFTRRKEN